MKPKQPASRFVALGTGRSYRSKPLREVPSLAIHEEDRLREVELVASGTDPRDEPEAIGPAILDDYAKVNRLIYTQQHALDVAAAQQLRPQLAAEDRLKDIHRRAKYAHVDLSHEIHIMRRDLEKARRRGQDPKPHTLDRMSGVEMLLDGVDLAA